MGKPSSLQPIAARWATPAELFVGLQEEDYVTMNPKIVITNETHDDVCAITEVTIAAFKTLEISNQEKWGL